MSDPFPKDPQIDYPRHYEAFLNATLGAVLAACPSCSRNYLNLCPLKNKNKKSP